MVYFLDILKNALGIISATLTLYGVLKKRRKAPRRRSRPNYIYIFKKRRTGFST